MLDWAALAAKKMSPLSVGKYSQVCVCVCRLGCGGGDNEWYYLFINEHCLGPGWDYMIGNSETAYNKVASLVMGLKESILEEKERKKEKRSWKRILLLIFTNIW